MTSYKSSINSANNIQSFPNRQFNLQLPTLIETERMQLIKPHPIISQRLHGCYKTLKV